MVNANRNLAAYESFGVPVWPDGLADYAGPLAGFLTGLERCETPYLLTVPCDTPLFPLDLAAPPGRRAGDATTPRSPWSARPKPQDDGAGCAAPAARVLPAAAPTLLESLRALHAGRRPQDRRLDRAAPHGARALRPRGRCARRLLQRQHAGRAARARSQRLTAVHEPHRRDRRRLAGYDPKALSVDARAGLPGAAGRAGRRHASASASRCATRSAACWPRTSSRRSACRRTTTRPWTASPSTARCSTRAATATLQPARGRHRAGRRRLARRAGAGDAREDHDRRRDAGRPRHRGAAGVLHASTATRVRFPAERAAPRRQPPLRRRRPDAGQPALRRGEIVSPGRAGPGGQPRHGRRCRCCGACASPTSRPATRS